MYCRKCGMQIDDGDRFCRKCGHPTGISTQTRTSVQCNYTIPGVNRTDLQNETSWSECQTQALEAKEARQRAAQEAADERKKRKQEAREEAQKRREEAQRARAAAMEKAALDQKPVSAVLMTTQDMMKTRKSAVGATGRAVVGGLLLGPAGALIGAATTKSKTVTTGQKVTFSVKYASGRTGVETVDVKSARFHELAALLVE